MKHSALTSISTVFDNTGFTTVYNASSHSITSSGWQTIQFSTPFSYNGSHNLLIDIYFDNTTAGGQGFLATTPSTSRVLYSRVSSDWGYGHPSTWTSAYNFTNPQLPNLRLLSGTSYPVTPSTIGPFVNGTWTGGIAPSVADPAIRFTASSGSISGISNFFEVLSPFVIQPEPPLTAGNTNTVMWNTHPSALEYQVQYSASPVFTSPVTSSFSNATSFLATGLADAQEYFYRVRLSNPSTGWTSGWSVPVSSTQDAAPPLISPLDSTASGTTLTFQGRATDPQRRQFRLAQW